MPGRRYKDSREKYFLGPIRTSFIGHSKDAEVRAWAASGGLVSSIIIHLLEKNLIDGALVCQVFCAQSKIKARAIIASDRQEVLRSAGSIYFEVNPFSDLKAMKEFPGRLALVGLPCQISLLNQLSETEPALKDKFPVKIGLFCGHNSRKALLSKVLEKNGIDEGDVARFRFRQGLWRGRSFIYLKNGSVKSIPFQRFSLYQNLHVLSLNKCLRCADHTAEEADLSLGDVWLAEFRGRKIKPSALLVRTGEGERIVRGMIEDGSVALEPCPPGKIFEAQKRALIVHKSLAVRSRLAPFFGLRLPPPKDAGPVRWNDYLTSAMVLLNYSLSRKSYGQKIFLGLPRKVLEAYLIFFKLLSNF